MPESTGLETGIYLLTPTHCGTGQVVGAVDLPIARERHTEHPILPATSLKGVLVDVRELDTWRGASGLSPEQLNTLFGPKPPGQDRAEGQTNDLYAGSLIVTDARLLAFPVRSLSSAYYRVTCPLVIDRWLRTRQALGLRDLAIHVDDVRNGVYGASAQLPKKLVIEDLVLPVHDATSPTLGRIAEHWAGLIPATAVERTQFASRLLCVPDTIFADLVKRTTPVTARVQLTEKKTTDNGGNLWYEETLPADCLFVVHFSTRPGKTEALTQVGALLKARSVFQVGGNETVGQGLYWWTPQGETSAPAHPSPTPKPGGPHQVPAPAPSSNSKKGGHHGR